MSTGATLLRGLATRISEPRKLQPRLPAETAAGSPVRQTVRVQLVQRHHGRAAQVGPAGFRVSTVRPCPGRAETFSKVARAHGRDLWLLVTSVILHNGPLPSPSHCACALWFCRCALLSLRSSANDITVLIVRPQVASPSIVNIGCTNRLTERAAESIRTIAKRRTPSMTVWSAPAAASSVASFILNHPVPRER